jgi:PAS domain S-box-containing protein
MRNGAWESFWKSLLTPFLSWTRIVLLNRMTEQLFGYRREELIGQTVELLVLESLRVSHERHRAQYLTHSAR